MLAAKFVEAEVKEYLDNYKDEFGQSIDPYFKKTLIALSEQIIKAYEKYKVAVNIKSAKCKHGWYSCSECC